MHCLPQAAMLGHEPPVGAGNGENAQASVLRILRGIVAPALILDRRAEHTCRLNCGDQAVNDGCTDTTFTQV
jgi:hypothetical protein